MKINLNIDKPPELLICCRGRQTIRLILKSEEKKNAEMKSTTLKLDQF